MGLIRKARCYFKKCDGDKLDPVKFWIWASPEAEGDRLQIGNFAFGFGLDLTPETTVNEADHLAELLRKHVKFVHLIEEHDPKLEADDEPGIVT